MTRSKNEVGTTRTPTMEVCSLNAQDALKAQAGHRCHHNSFIRADSRTWRMRPQLAFVWWKNKYAIRKKQKNEHNAYNLNETAQWLNEVPLNRRPFRTEYIQRFIATETCNRFINTRSAHAGYCFHWLITIMYKVFDLFMFNPLLCTVNWIKHTQERDVCDVIANRVDVTLHILFHRGSGHWEYITQSSCVPKNAPFIIPSTYELLCINNANALTENRHIVGQTIPYL